MKKFLALLLALALTACAPNKYERAQKSVVLIESSHGYGSGFIVQHGDKLFVWTAAHVVSNVNELKVRQVIRVNGHKVGESAFTATVIARDESLDLALLWLDAPVSFFNPVEFSPDPRPLRVGTPVFHCGNFSGPRFDGSISTGVVSQVGVNPGEGTGFIWPIADQTTSLVLPGSSGGPLFNEQSEVVGVIVGHLVPGVEFFVPLRAVELSAETQHVSWAVRGKFCPSAARLRAYAAEAKCKPLDVTPVGAPVVPPAPPKKKALPGFRKPGTV